MTDWWFAHAETYNLDTKNVSMLGISAGAALMLMSASQDIRDRVSRLDQMSGVYDFNNLSGGPQFMRRRFSQSQSPVYGRPIPLYSFKKHCHCSVIHGTEDHIVPVAQTAAWFKSVRTKTFL